MVGSEHLENKQILSEPQASKHPGLLGPNRAVPKVPLRSIKVLLFSGIQNEARNHVQMLA